MNASDAVLAAALLHDAVEDSELRVGEVVERFGVEVGELVAALTEDASIDDWVERKDALRRQVAAAGEGAVAIYLADKLANLRDMRHLYARLGEDSIDLHKAPTLDLRIAAWSEDAAMARRVSPEAPFVARLRRELEALERDRARGAGAAQGAIAST